MSSLIIEVCKIDDIIPHDNADKLEIVSIKGWYCVVPKNRYKKGDKVIYIPVDSMIPLELSEELGITQYLDNCKKDDNGNIISLRVKTVRLRGALSQGVVIDVRDPSWNVGDDVKDKLGITKYIAELNPKLLPEYSKWRLPNYPEFKNYTEIENFKNYPDIIKDGEEVVITEKIHGTNFKCGKLIIVPVYIMDKIILMLKKIGKKLSFGLYDYDPFTFLVGNHTCNIKRVKKWEQISKESMGVYWQISLKYELDKKLKDDEEAFGEIYGNGIQKILRYDGEEEIKARLFDMKAPDKLGNMRYLDWDPFVKVCKDRNLPIVPVLYKGPFNKEILIKLSSGNSTIGNHIREGCIIKPVKERFDPKLGRVILKYINDDYLILMGKVEAKLKKEGKNPNLDIFDH